jgi:hypothetical protein
MTVHASEAEAREFAAAFSAFLNWIHQSDQESAERNPAAAMVADFLGPEGAVHSVVSRDLPVFEHVNLQTAVDAWSARDGRTVDVQLLEGAHQAERPRILHDPHGLGGGTSGDGTAQTTDHGGPTVTGAHLARALDDLLDSAQGVTRTLLGVGVDPATLPAGGALGMSPMVMAQRRMAVGRTFRSR